MRVLVSSLRCLGGYGRASKSIHLATDEEALQEYDGGHDYEWHVLYEQSVCDIEA